MSSSHKIVMLYRWLFCLSFCMFDSQFFMVLIHVHGTYTKEIIWKHLIVSECLMSLVWHCFLSGHSTIYVQNSKITFPGLEGVSINQIYSSTLFSVAFWSFYATRFLELVSSATEFFSPLISVCLLVNSSSVKSKIHIFCDFQKKYKRIKMKKID